MKELSQAQECAENRRRQGRYVRKSGNPGIAVIISMACLCLMTAMSIYTIWVCRHKAETVTIPDVTQPAVTHPTVPYAPPENPAQKKIREYAQSHGLSVRDYPKSFVELLERNPETETFVLEYPNHTKTVPDLSKYDPKKGIPLFMQWDQQWGYEKYGSDAIGITGCGPTCLAMAGYYLTGDKRFTPDQVASFAESSGYYQEGKGSSWSLISEGGKKLGMDVVEIPLDENRIMANLQCGNPIICVVGPGDFTTDGHFIVLSGYQGSAIQVNDPNSHKNSERLWTYQELAPQINNLWVLRRE